MQEIQDSTTVTTTGLVFLMIMAVLTVVLRRDNALVPLLVTVCYMPLGQRFVIGGLHFHFFRILLLMGICRVFLRGEAAGLRITGLDKLFLCWMVASLVL